MLEQEEQFELVDEEGHVIGLAPRSECHSNPELIHRTVHVFVKNSNGDYLLQKRSENKDIQPGKWDTSVGGHFCIGEEKYAAAVRELHEELGIEDISLRFLYRYIWRSDCESELVNTFIAVYDGNYFIQKEEIDEARFWSVGEIEIYLENNIFTPNFVYEWKKMKEFMIKDNH
ncbi:MAG: NUDIX domain-containing protein [Candidatus Theseobacter exili]|nr:NUDIX domain-containing protein [Candidatus Theseobacter exili]